MNPKNLVLLFGLLFCSEIAYAQKSNTKIYAKRPVWIGMMNDSTNYFEALKAFETYWKFHPKPKEEDEIIGEHRKKEKLGRKEERAEEKQEESNKLTFQYKRFKWWQMKVEPWVQEDGSILSKEKQQEIEKKLR
jgi:hypothetical protein